MLSKWLYLTVGYAELMIVNQDGMIHNHWFRIAHHYSKPLAQNNTP
jgi:hypothetical protein